MAKKRTKSDKEQRQADELEKKLERRPAEIPRKKAAREEVNQAGARIVRAATGE